MGKYTNDPEEIWEFRRWTKGKKIVNAKMTSKKVTLTFKKSVVIISVDEVSHLLSVGSYRI